MYNNKLSQDQFVPTSLSYRSLSGSLAFTLYSGQSTRTCYGTSIDAVLEQPVFAV